MQHFLIKALQHQDRIVKCSLTDHFVFRTPVPIVFFYPQIIDSNRIIRALQHVLHDFPIFAGVLFKMKGRLCIDCNNQGVSVTISHSPLSMLQQLANFPTIPSTTFVDLIDPYKTVKKRSPVLTIKINYYIDGMTIGYCWHHSIGDMATFMELLKAVSAYAQGKSYQKPLIVEDREQYLQQWQEPADQCTHSGLKRLTFIDVFRLAKAAISPKRFLFMYLSENEVASLRDTISEQSGIKLSRNCAVCAHLLDLIAQCRSDEAQAHHASVIVNYRKRKNMPLHLLGNYVDSLALKFPKPVSVDMLAKTIHSALNNYNFHPSETLDFVEKNGGIRKINRMIPSQMLPQNKNLFITNWSKFGVYSIDFGVASPCMFLPTGKIPFPWIACIVEGFNNNGLLLTLALPRNEAKRLNSSAMQDKVHKFRRREDAVNLEYNSWCI